MWYVKIDTEWIRCCTIMEVDGIRGNAQEIRCVREDTNSLVCPRRYTGLEEMKKES